MLDVKNDSQSLKLHSKFSLPDIFENESTIQNINVTQLLSHEKFSALIFSIQFSHTCICGPLTKKMLKKAIVKYKAADKFILQPNPSGRLQQFWHDEVCMQCFAERNIQNAILFLVTALLGKLLMRMLRGRKKNCTQSW